MEEYASKRVNYSYLSKFVNKRVTIVGSVKNLTNQQLILESTDSKDITIKLNNVDTSSIQSKYVEVTGIVSNDLSIECNDITPLPGQLDNEAWNKLIECIHKFPEIF